MINMATVKKLIWVIIACAVAIVCVNVKNYRAIRAEIRNDINASFRQLAPYWPDSIFRITDEPMCGSFDTEHYKKRNVNYFSFIFMIVILRLLICSYLFIYLLFFSCIKNLTTI